MPEYVYDAQAGEALPSRNGVPVDAPTVQLELPLETVQPEALDVDSEELTPVEETPEEQPQGFNRQQQGAVEFWTDKGLNPTAAFSWIDGDSTPVSEAGYAFVAEKFASSDPVEIGKAVALVSTVYENQSKFDYVEPEQLESLPSHVEEALIKEMGETFTSDVVSLNHRVGTGEISYAEARQIVFDNPELLNGFMRCADKGLLRFSI